MSIDWDSEIKAPQEAILDLPQERITGDILRGRGPRRGNLERLIKYWRPIMRKPGGFRRCLVILADHPELYPLERICAWLHHETTGLWPNEGNHHEGGKLGPIVRAAKRTVKKPKKRKRRGKKSLDFSEMNSYDYDYEYSFKDMVNQSRSFNGLLVQPIAGRQNVLEAKAAMFGARLDEVADRQDEIRVKRVGIVGSNSAAGQALQGVGSILLPGDISDFRSPVRSQIYETLTPGGGRGLGLRRVVRGAGRGARNKYRCPPGFQKGGTFTNKFYSTCGAQILGIPSFGPGAFATGIERALARLARDASLVRSIGDLKNNSNPYDIIRAAQIPFAPKKTSPTRRQTSVDLVLARIANGENVPTRFVRRDGVILEPKVSFEELGKLDEFDDMVDGSLITKYDGGILGEGSLGTFGTGLRDNYISLDEGIVKVSREGGELDPRVRDNTFRAFNAAVAKNTGRNPDRTAPLLDFIETSDGKFTVEFGEIKNNAFIPDNTAKNELVQVRSGGVTKLVPKWVYDTFLSRSAPRRLEADPIFELIDNEEKSVSPFFNAKKINKEDPNLAHDYFKLVNEKAANFTRLTNETEMEIKAPRLGRAARRIGRGAGRGLRGTASAIFDNALGRWRCPPGTRRGGTFSDRLGSNCGYSLPANIVNNLSKATNAIQNIRRKGEGRREKASKATKALSRLNNQLEEVLNITESRTGGRLGRTIGQRRSIGSLTPDQEKLFSGEQVQETINGLQEDINDVLQNGNRREVERVWEQVTKLANLEAGRLTDNTSTDEKVEKAGRRIQMVINGWSTLLGNPSGPSREENLERGRQQAVAVGTRRAEKIKRLARNIVRGMRMRRDNEDIGDVSSPIFYNEDGTVNEEFLQKARTTVESMATNSRDKLRAGLKLVGYLGLTEARNMSDDELDKRAVDYIKTVGDRDIDMLVTGPNEDLRRAASVISNLNTFREMRDLIADDDTRFAKAFEDALRRINKNDRNDILRRVEINDVFERDNEFEPQLDQATLQRMREQQGNFGLETRFGVTNFKNSIKQKVQDRRTAIRTAIDKAIYRNYVDGTSVNERMRDTILDNPNLPAVVGDIATVPWADHRRLVMLRNQEKMAIYKMASDGFPDTPEGNAKRADFYKQTGLYVAPESDWNALSMGDSSAEILETILDGDELESPEGIQKAIALVDKMMGNVEYTDSNGNVVNTSGVKLKGTFTILGPDGPVEVERWVEYNPKKISNFKGISPDKNTTVEVSRINDGITVKASPIFQLRRVDTGEIVFEGFNEGDSWDHGSLNFEMDFRNGRVRFDTAGMDTDTERLKRWSASPGWSDGYALQERLGVEQDISFADGGYFGQMVERATPFFVGHRLNEFSVDSTAHTGQATWLRYGLSVFNTSEDIDEAKERTNELIKGAEAAIDKIRAGRTLGTQDIIALTLVRSPENLRNIKDLERALDPSNPDSPNNYDIYSVMVGLKPNGDLKRSTSLYRAMVGSRDNRRDDDGESLTQEMNEALAAFGSTISIDSNTSEQYLEDFEVYGSLNEFSGSLSNQQLDIKPLISALDTERTAFNANAAKGMASELADIRNRLNPNVPRDAYGKRLDSIDKRHSALMTEEERARSASEIERAITKLTNEGILGEDDPEVINLVNLAAELRNSSDFPEETRGTGDLLDDIAVDLGDEATLRALIDDVDSLIEEVDTPADLEKLRKVLQDALGAPSGKVASKDVTKADKDATPNFFDKFSKVFRGRKFRTNFFKNDSESDKNAQIAGQLTIFDELNAQTDRTNEVARRGVDAVMEQVADIAAANGMTPEEVVERAVAHALRDTDFTPAPPASAGDLPSAPPSSPAAQMTFSQGKIQDMRLMNHTLKTMLASIVNRPNDDDFNIFQDPTILEDGTLIGRTNPDGSLITKAQATEMLQAVTRLDERIEEAFNFFGNRSDSAPLVLAETEEELDQLISAFSMRSNVPGDDYLFMRMSNLSDILQEAKARRNRPEGTNMISTSALGGRRQVTAGESPSAPEVRRWVQSAGFPEDPDLDEQIYKLRTDEGLTLEEVATRLNMDRFEVRVREAEHKQKLSEAELNTDRVTRNTNLNARRVDAYDSDRGEVEQILVEEEGLSDLEDRAAGLPEGFSLEELIDQTIDVDGGIPIPGPNIPEDEVDVDVTPTTAKVDINIANLDDLLTSLENRVNSLQAAIERVANDSRGPRRPRDPRRPRAPRAPRAPRGPRGFDLNDPRRFDNLTIDQLMDAVGESGNPVNGWQSTFDERAMNALRKRLRDMSDEELLDLYNRRGSRRNPFEPVPFGTYDDPVAEAITAAAQRRGLTGFGDPRDGILPIRRIDTLDPDFDRPRPILGAPESVGGLPPAPRTRRGRDDEDPDLYLEYNIPSQIRDPETGKLIRNPEYSELDEDKVRRRRRRAEARQAEREYRADRARRRAAEDARETQETRDRRAREFLGLEEPDSPESVGVLPTPPPDPDDPSFQSRVWDLRTNGLSVEETAESLGVDRGLVRQAEVKYGRSLDRAEFDEAMASARVNARRRSGEGLQEGMRATDLEERLWDLRTRQGYTIDEAAEELGIDRVEARNLEVGYARKLTPAQRERDYERGRSAALLRQEATAAPDDLGDDLADAGTPNLDEIAESLAPESVDDTPPRPPRSDKEIFDEMVSDPNFKFSEDTSTAQKNSDLTAFMNELEKLSDEEQAEILGRLDPDSDVFRPFYHDQLIGTEDSENFALGQSFGTTEAYVSALKRSENARRSAERIRSQATTPEDLTNMTETLTDADAPEPSRFQRIKDRIVAKLSATMPGGNKFPDPERPGKFLKKKRPRFTDITMQIRRLPLAIQDIGKKNEDGEYEEFGAKWKFFDAGKKFYVVGDAARAVATGQFADFSRVDVVSDSTIEEIVDIMGFAPDIQPDGSFRAIGTKSGSLILKTDNQGNDYLQYTAANYLTNGGSRGTVINFAPMRKELDDGTFTTEGATIEDEMRRRDFTVNALALDMLPEGVENARGAGQGDKSANPDVIDLTGALADLGLEVDEKGELKKRQVFGGESDGVVFGEQGPIVRPYLPGDTAEARRTQTTVATEPELADSVIRAVGDPKERIAQDPLRALRAIGRLVTGNNDGKASLDPDLEAAIREADLSQVSPERLFKEMQKRLATVPSTRRYFEELEKHGLLQKMFPDVNINLDSVSKVRSIDRNEAVILAAMLDGNPVSKVDEVLDRMGVSQSTADAVKILQELKNSKVDEDNILDTLDKVKRLATADVSTTDMFGFGPLSGLDAPTTAALIEMANNPAYADFPDGRAAVEILTTLQGSFEELDYVKDPSNLSNIIQRAVAQGGATINVAERTDVTSGWAISRNGMGIVIDTDDLIDRRTGKPKPEAMQRIYAIIRKNLGTESEIDGSKVALGMWREKKRDRRRNADGSLAKLTGDREKDFVETDVMHVDITDVIPVESMSEEDAIEAGNKMQQKSIANLDNIDSGNWNDAFINLNPMNNPDLLDEATDTDIQDGQKEYKQVLKKAAVTRTEPVSLPEMLSILDDQMIRKELDELVDPESSMVLPRARKNQQGTAAYNEKLDNYLEILKKNFERQDRAGQNRKGIIDYIDNLRANIADGGTPQTGRATTQAAGRATEAAQEAAEETPTPAVAKTVRRTVDADALEGDALRAELLSIVDELKADYEDKKARKLGVDLGDLRIAGDKVEEGFGRELVSKLNSALGDSNETNIRQRLQDIKEDLELATEVITIKVTPLTEQIDDAEEIVDDE